MAGEPQDRDTSKILPSADPSGDLTRGGGSSSPPTRDDPVRGSVTDSRRFRRLLWRSAAFPLALLAAVTLVLSVQVQRLLHSAEWVQHTSTVIAEAYRVGSAASEMQAAYRGFLLSGRPEFRAAYVETVARTDEYLAGIGRLVADYPDQVARLGAVRGSLGELRTWYDRGFTVLTAGGRDDEAAALAGGQTRIDRFRATLLDFVHAEAALRDERGRAVRESARSFVVGSLVAATGLAVVFVRFFRQGMQELQAAYAAALDSSERHAREVEQLNRTLEARIAERTRQLEADRDFLSAVLQSVSDGIVACDEHGKLTLFNEATRQMHGLEVEPLPPERWAERFDLCQPDGHTPLTTEQIPLFRALQGEIVREVEFVISPKPHTNLSPRRVVCSGRSLRSVDGQTVGAVVSMHDVTEARHQEQALRDTLGELARANHDMEQANVELERSNRELQDFASVASHDLQEPLRKIRAFGDRLRVKAADRLDEASRDYLDRMQQAAGRMSVLIEDLLTFSRVTTRAKAFRPVPLDGVLADVLEDLSDRTERTGAKVEVGELPTVMGDATQLRQVFQNLVGNALKFAKPDRPPLVRVRRHPDDPQAAPTVTIEVSDDGIGFDEKYRDKIFMIFQRLHGRGEYEGTGIGLAIVRKIVERHGGTIEAHSKPGEGARFVITLAAASSPAVRPQPDAPTIDGVADVLHSPQNAPAVTRVGSTHDA